jgi:flagellar protein FlbT
MHITLRANEKIYVNGAVLKVDRKVSFELLNDAVFLLEGHVMHERDASTPMRQLYYIVQLMLMDPGQHAANQAMLLRQTAAMAAVYEDQAILEGLPKVTALSAKGRHFEALKLIRTMLPLEAKILAPAAPLVLAAAS